MGHTAWAPEGREGRYQAGPKGRSLEVGARRAPRLLVHIYLYHIFYIYLSIANKGRSSDWTNSCKPLISRLITMGIMMTMMPMMTMIKWRWSWWQRLPIHMGGSMVGEHAPIRDPCLVVSCPTRWSLYWYLGFYDDHLSQHPDNRERVQQCRDTCLVDAVQIDAVLADDLENMTSSMMMMSMSMSMMKMMMMMMMMKMMMMMMMPMR